MPTLDEIRRFYADEVRAVANVRNHALVEAFAVVPRERFLGPGPWQIAYADPGRPGRTAYYTTDDADPRHLYHNVLVAIDAARELNNGHPSSLAAWLEALALRHGDRVFHVGCGVGYYTAIIAHVVGPRGRVLAIEADLDLAERARAALADYPQAEVVTGDGTAHDPGPVDAVFASAGLTHPPARWLDRLAEGGRLLVPLTAALGGPAGSVGWMLKVTHAAGAYAARFISPVAIFPSVGGRDPALNDQLRAALAKGTWGAVTTLRRDAHERGDACWLHADGFCLTTAAPAGVA